MPTKKEYYEGSSDVTNRGVFGHLVGSGALERLGQEFQVSENFSCTSVEVFIGEDGTVTDNIIVRIETNSGGFPSGTLVDSNAVKSISGNISSTKQWVSFEFPAVFTLSTSTIYHLVLERDGSRDNNNRVNWDLDNTSPSYPSGNAESQDTTVWSNDVDGVSGDFLFRIFGQRIPTDYTDTVTATVSLTVSASSQVAYVTTATDTVTITNLLFEAKSLKTDYKYFLGTTGGTVHLHNEDYKGDAGVIIPCQYVTKDTDFSDQDFPSNDRWKTIYAIKLFYEDMTADTDVSVSISTDGGVTYSNSQSQVLGNGDKARKDTTFFFIMTGQFFRFMLSSGSASTTFKFLGMEIEYEDAGPHWVTA